MTFNIGRQTGGVVNNVAGDQHVEGGQHGVQVSTHDAMTAAATLRELLAEADLSSLSDSDRATVVEDAAAIDEEMTAAQPSPETVLTRLERLTKVLGAAGALAGAGAAMLGPIGALAGWLGPFGASVMRMLPIG
ncbi:MAG TPA: hypothetical protein VFL10_02820 [Ornithinibacter sp.]|nr:hypothetical protein [Ornithinibacter sp.]